MAASDPSNQWLFTDDELDSTPSIIDGLSPTEERYRRTRGVSFIGAICNLLQLPQVTASTASLFFHRFFMRRSMIQEKGGIHHYNVAATALFIAMKSEETIRSTKPFIIACVKVAQKNPNLDVDVQSKEYWRWRDSILMYEELMLELLCFDLAVKSPLVHITGYLEEIKQASQDTLTTNLWKELRNFAWAFICDSHHSVLGLMVTPQTIAITALLFSATAKKIEIPQIGGKDWWEHLGGKEDQIVKAGVYMHTFLSNSPFVGSEQTPPSSMTTKYLHRSSGKGEKGEETNSSEESSRTLDAPNGNGYVADNGANGMDHAQSASEPAKHDESDISMERVETSVKVPENASGSDDAALKAAANDLSTHIRNGQHGEVNGVSESSAPDDAKRKADTETQAPVPKRPKIEDSQTTVQSHDEGQSRKDPVRNSVRPASDESENTLQNETPRHEEPKPTPAPPEIKTEDRQQSEEGELEQ